MNKIINSMLMSINRNISQQKILLNNIANFSTPNFRSQSFFDQKPNPSDDQPITSERYADPDKQEERVTEDIELLSDVMMHKDNFFSALDNEGKEVFIRVDFKEKIKLNKNRELSIENFRLLDTDNNVIVIKNGYDVVVQPDFSIVVSKSNNDAKRNVFLSRIKSIGLEDSDIIPRKNSNFCDLNQSGLEKYKENESDILLGNTPYHPREESDVNLTENLIKALSSVRHVRADITVVSRTNKNEERANILLNGSI